MIPPALSEETSQMQEGGLAVELLEAEGWFNVVFTGYPLPRGYSKRATTLLVKVPPSYPNGRPDMFWVDEDVLLETGAVPRSADSIETALGRRWRRFSWHPQNWNPGVDSLRTYLEFVNRRLAQVL